MQSGRPAASVAVPGPRPPSPTDLSALRAKPPAYLVPRAPNTTTKQEGEDAVVPFDPASVTTLGRALLPGKESGPLTELARGRTATRLEAEHRKTLVAAEAERRKTLIIVERERRETITAVIRISPAGTVVADREPGGRTLSVKIPATRTSTDCACRGTA